MAGARIELRQCRRVLRPGGIVRLATPDLAELVADYIGKSSPFLSRYDTPADAFCGEYRAYSDPQANGVKKFVKKVLGGDSHQWLYDADSLAHLLREGGFTEIRRRAFREGAHRSSR